MSLTKAQANTASTIAANANEATMETAFYFSVDAMILNATTLGQFKVIVTTPDGVDNQALVNYYISLGYAVNLLDVSFTIPFVYEDPFWVNYVNYSFGFPNLNIKKSMRLSIVWS